MTIATRSVETPLGRYALCATERGLVSVLPARGRTPARTRVRHDARDDARARAHLAAAAAALREYFAGRRSDFADLALAPQGSAFLRRVWRALAEIPYGRTESYGALARRIGRPGAARAVGRANACNPLALVVPCHRVIGSAGELRGYAGGEWRKRWLLTHEASRATRAAGSPLQE